jgi:altronate dehydratase
MQGFLRSDGRKGIRNVVAVAYLVECARHVSDNAEIVELIASGCHLTLFTTGRGSVVGSAISPVIKICANPDTYRRMADDMDIDAGRILEGHGTLDEVGREEGFHVSFPAG